MSKARCYRMSQKNSVFGELKCFTDASVLHEIGNELRPGSATSLLFWLAVHGAIPHGPVTALSLGDFVVSRLCNAPPKAEPTLALGTIHLGTGGVHTSWFQRLGFGHVSWAELGTVSQPVGQCQIASQIVPCYPAVGDQQAALFGADLQEGELSINASTGSQVSLLTRTLERGDYQSRHYFDGRYLNTITHLPAGRSLNALVDLLTELPRAEGCTPRDPWQHISEAVANTPTTDVHVDLSFFEGPMGDRGHIRNLRLENLSLGHIFRAAFEHMADNYAACAARLSPSRHWKQIVFSGGLPQKVPSLRDIITARFGCPSRTVDAAEETLHGLLKLAARNAGISGPLAPVCGGEG
jgi:sugar (pentulose or hexulose) kinase